MPVLVEEVLEGLQPQAGQWIVDGTFGGGGHTRLLAERVQPGGTVLALDLDAGALARAEALPPELPIKLMQANYANLPEVLRIEGVSAVDGVLLDLGLSSDQLADTDRGFSFEADGPLDLRFDATEGEPAWQLLERLDATQIADLLYQFGEERRSRLIARRIVDTRREHPIRSASDLVKLVVRCVPRSPKHRIHPATRTFQALRIAVNQELRALEQGLENIPDCLTVGGRLAIISFHSLEDRRVKWAFRNDPRLKPLTRRPIEASEAEKAENPRARSAKLRVAERVDADQVT